MTVLSGDDFKQEFNEKKTILLEWLQHPLTTKALQMTISSPPGVFDIIPNDSKDEWKSSHLWNYLESIARRLAFTYGYSEIRTPLFERTELFQRGVGETTDIVSKEMYTFLDKGNRSMSLRPEGTAPVMRAFIEHQLEQQGSIQKLFYIAPMFRYERAQAGRYRQHHQFGVEAIGSTAPEQDAELIDLLYTFYRRLGLTHLELHLNSIGDIACRIAYRTALREYLKGFFDKLSIESQNRFQVNPMRILDSKDPGDRAILQKAPSILNFLNPECSDHFESVKMRLSELSIPYTVNSQLVRGLDYYNKTVFEVVAGELGAQNSIGGGGRYDGLLKQLGGPDLPTIGFGTGLERVLQTLLKQKVLTPSATGPLLQLIALGEEAKRYCFLLLHQLRQQDIPASLDFSGRKLGKLLQAAEQQKISYVAIIGENELRTQELDLKQMETNSVIRLRLEQLAPYLLRTEVIAT